jgi:hypothetical protein
VQALDRLLDDELVFTTLNGVVVGKAEDLALHRSGMFKITRMDPGERPESSPVSNGIERGPNYFVDE